MSNLALVCPSTFFHLPPKPSPIPLRTPQITREEPAMTTTGTVIVSIACILGYASMLGPPLLIVLRHFRQRMRPQAGSDKQL